MFHTGVLLEDGLFSLLALSRVELASQWSCAVGGYGSDMVDFSCRNSLASSTALMKSRRRFVPNKGQDNDTLETVMYYTTEIVQA